MTIAIVMPCTFTRAAEVQEALDFMNPPEMVPIYLVVDRTFKIDWDVTFIERGPLMNLSRWYNLGLGIAQADGFDHILYAESDVRIDWHDVTRMRDVLVNEQLSMVGPDLYNRGQYSVRRKRGAVPIWDRIAQCFVIEAAEHARMDEDYKWWYEAENLEWAMRERSGTRLVSAPTSFHPFSGTTQLSGDHERAVAIAEGRAKFKKTWGSLPF